MNTKLTTIRHDDFDFRMSPSQYINIHEKFIGAGVNETAVLQFTSDNRVKTFDPTLIKYMNEAPNWEFAVHGWSHAEYDGMDFDHIVRDLSACLYWTQRLFHKSPTVWYPPWNRYSIPMERAAVELGLTIDNESFDIAKFIRAVKANDYNGHSLYFHGWKADEMIQFEEMLYLAKPIYGTP